MKIAIQDKVYKITFGATAFQEKQSMRVLRNVDSSNIDSITVIAKDAYDALDKVADYLLKKEKEYLKEDMQVWVESVDCLNFLQDLED